ncbi:hypothetical protein V8G54_021653, partial [Vigna mungo]
IFVNPLLLKSTYTETLTRASALNLVEPSLELSSLIAQFHLTGVIVSRRLTTHFTLISLRSFTSLLFSIDRSSLLELSCILCRALASALFCGTVTRPLLCRIVVPVRRFLQQQRISFTKQSQSP